jgi:uncharacterized protein (TIGR03118 family)
MFSISLAVASLVSLIALPVLAAPSASQPQNRYALEVFHANDAQYQPSLGVEKPFVNAWGIAIRPKGAGGHFWVTAKDISYEYVGDVRASADEKLRPMHQDELKIVKLPVGGADKFATGTVFSGSDRNFTITQEISGKEPITAPAKFLFASDGGIISAWTERKLPDGSFDRSGEAITVIDQSKQGAQFFGIAVSHDYSRLYAADFGRKPAIKVFDGQFRPLDIRFDQPFDINKDGDVEPGEFAPFNVQALTTPAGENHLFVTYARTRACPDKAVTEGDCAAGQIYPGEEDKTAGAGRLAEFTEDGKLVRVWPDDRHLTAPWGVAYAPANFGKLSNALLVGNFGDGTIAAFDAKTHAFIDVLRDAEGNPFALEGLWGLLFGNGEGLGDTNALYVAAGPQDEEDGVFGALRPVTQAP